jgi:hypothetical protein
MQVEITGSGSGFPVQALASQVGDPGCPIQVVGSNTCFMQVEITGSGSGFPVPALASQVGDPGCPIQVVGSNAGFMQVEVTGSGSGPPVPVSVLALQIGDPEDQALPFRFRASDYEQPVPFHRLYPIGRYQSSQPAAINWVLPIYHSLPTAISITIHLHTSYALNDNYRYSLLIMIDHLQFI